MKFFRTYDEGVKNFLFLCLIFLALLPVWNINHILATTGADVLSNDDVVFLLNIVGPALEGKYEWGHLFRDVFYNGHFLFLPALVYLVAARVSHLNVYLLLFFSTTLAFIRLVLTYHAFKLIGGDNHHPVDWLFLPLISALVFSTSQISIFEHPFVATTTAVNQLGVALSIWGLTRYRDNKNGFWVILLGGMIASLSFSNGMLVWPALFVGLIAFGIRNWRFYLAWLAGLILSAFPYFYFLVIHPLPYGETTVKSWFNPQVITQLVGVPFAQNFEVTQAQFAGFVGLGVLLIGIFLIVRDKEWKVLLQQASPALMLLSYGLLGIWILSVFRGRIAPWYTYVSIYFWVGLLGLAYVFLSRNINRGGEVYSPHGVKKPHLIWGGVVWVVIILLYLPSNMTYMDKSMFLRARSPVAASCLRNYSIAPTYCENMIFTWYPGRFYLIPELGYYAEKYHLSSFSPRQEWALQGDFVLDTVQVLSSNPEERIGWTPDSSGERVSYMDYRHLNLLLPHQTTLTWRVTLPSNAKEAVLKSAAALGQLPNKRGETATLLKIFIDTQEGESKLLYQWDSSHSHAGWTQFSISLQKYIAQQVTLRFVVKTRQKASPLGGMVLLRYPVIDLNVDYKIPAQAFPKLERYIPPVAAGDFILHPSQTEGWHLENIALIPDRPGIFTFQSGANLTYSFPFNICLDRYAYFVIRMRMSTDAPTRQLHLERRLMNVWLDLITSDGQSVQREVRLPFYPEDTLQDYAFKLGLLELPPGTSLVGLGLEPYYRPEGLFPEVEIDQIRFVPGVSVGTCPSK